MAGESEAGDLETESGGEARSGLFGRIRRIFSRRRTHERLGEEEADYRIRHGSVISTRPLPVELIRPPSWNRLFRRWVHRLRYGYTHPDQDLLGVIDAVGDALNVQLAAVQGIVRGDRAREATALKAELDRELRKRLPDFSALLGIEARINALYPPALARRRQWVLRERFERVAAPEAYQYWFHNWLNNPPPDGEEEAIEALLARAEEAVATARLNADQAAAALDQARQQVETADQAGTAEEVLHAAEAAGDALRRAEEAKAEADRILADALRRRASARARCALVRARADLDRKRKAADQARQHVAGMPVDHPDRRSAQDNADRAEAEHQAARSACEERAASLRAIAGVDADDEEEPGPLTEAEADNQVLLGYIHTSYLMSINREKTVRDLKRWLLVGFVGFLISLVIAFVIVWLLLLWGGGGQYWTLIFGLMLIAAAGRIGATTSIIRRLQTAVSDRVLSSDPIVELTALRTGKNEITLALLSSSVFALLLYALFISGVPGMLGMKGGVFPTAAQWDSPPAALANRDQPGGSDGQNIGGTAAKVPPDQRTSGETGGVDRGSSDEQPEPGSAKQPGQASDPASAGREAATEDQSRSAISVRERGALLAASAPVPLADLRHASDRVNAARSRYVAAIGERSGLHWLQFWARWELNQQMHRAAEDAADGQRLALQAAQRGYSSARRSGNADWIAAWQETEREARDLLEDLVSIDDWLEGREGPQETPKLRCDDRAICTPFPALARALGLQAPEDFFKLLLWAFIAGFAERFVPDVLDRIVAQTRGSSALPARAVFAAQANSRASGSAQQTTITTRATVAQPSGP